MKVLLVRPYYPSIFSIIDPVITEPLELEYLVAGCHAVGVACELYDGSVTERAFVRKLRRYRPDVVGISGYITARDIMLGALKTVKKVLPGAVTVVGGVHAELNEKEFYAPQTDLIVHSGGVLTFMALLERLKEGGDTLLDGVTRRDGAPFERAPYRRLDTALLPHPDRTHFYANRHRYKYLHYGPVALVKSAWGCPFNCNFCYCTELYEGKYLVRPIEDVVDEIEAIDHRILWIIDDTFLVNRRRVERFLDLVEARGRDCE